MRQEVSMTIRPAITSMRPVLGDCRPSRRGQPARSISPMMRSLEPRVVGRWLAQDELGNLSVYYWVFGNPRQLVQACNTDDLACDISRISRVSRCWSIINIDTAM